MNKNSDVLQKEFRVAQVIWAAIFAALVIYVAIGHFIFGREFVDAESIPLHLIRNILAGVGGLMLLGSFFIRRTMLFGSGTGQLPDAGQLPGSGQLVDAGAVAAKFKMATMIAAGVCEVVGLFGLVLVFLGDSLLTLYLFNVVAAVAMMLHRPRMEELQRLARGPVNR